MLLKSLFKIVAIFLDTEIFCSLMLSVKLNGYSKTVCSSGLSKSIYLFIWMGLVLLEHGTFEIPEPEAKKVFIIKNEMFCTFLTQYINVARNSVLLCFCLFV